MTQELLERTARLWVMDNPARGARALERLTGTPVAGRPPEDVADALIQLAGRLHLAATRSW